MRISPRSLWQKIQQYPVRSSVIAVVLIIAAFAFLVYKFGWEWTGFNGGLSKITTTSITHGVTTVREQLQTKTLWDWLQLLIIPVVLALGGYVFNLTINKNEQKSIQSRDLAERELALDRLREDALRTYFEKMSELLMKEKLRESDPNTEVRNVARALTLTALGRLDADRKRSLVQFLHESGLITMNVGYGFIKGNSIISLKGADLARANLVGFDLSKTDLSSTNLNEANLSGANLSEANLSGASLSGALLIGTDLSGANLHKAYLSRAELGDIIFNQLPIVNLSGANLRKANLSKANLSGSCLIGTNLSEADLSEASLHHADLSDNMHIDTASQAEVRAVISYGTSPPSGIDVIGFSFSHADNRMFVGLTFRCGANLSKANLSGTDLDDADLTKANLEGITITSQQLEKAKTLQGTIMPDGTTHP